MTADVWDELAKSMIGRTISDVTTFTRNGTLSRVEIDLDDGREVELCAWWDGMNDQGGLCFD